MAIRGIRATDTIPFVSKNDPCYSADGNHKEGATVFQLRPLDGILQGHIKDVEAKATLGFSGEQRSIEIEMMLYRGAFESCRVGILGWTNYQDERGGDIPFSSVQQMIARREYTVVSEECLRSLPPDLALEISKKLQEAPLVTKTEEGNSEGA